ncbi:type IV pilus twitching motility protein PilT [Anoxybacterium hadale]|uniref:Type IV pilus twitching motility protein PilT n=1 Tax=Anoxybacterium hadale TaxID=3408580 RepID=A0ACD1A9L7_9FIRM|nr:type IV pilus twitching motility protein PilT [Clostridiales bacterium]
MVRLEELLEEALDRKASDIHITAGLPPMLRIYGKLVPYGGDSLLPEDTSRLLKEIVTQEQYEQFQRQGEYDLSWARPGVSRFRVNAFRQRGSDAIVIRVIAFSVPTLEELEMPDILKELAGKTRGLILVTGPTGSGKSTTLAAMINEINSTREVHVLTLEDPIEYLHKHKRSIVNQREIGHDTKSYANALRSAMREDPDVILVGEMRDLETISIAVTAAETGHLVLSTLHTVGASKTIDRIVDVFPPYQQKQIMVQLSAVLEGVVSQQLIERFDEEGRACAMEIMLGTSAIRNLIREGKTHMLDSSIQTGNKYGMKSMDMSLAELVKKGLISEDEANLYCVDKEMLRKFLQNC